MNKIFRIFLTTCVLLISTTILAQQSTISGLILDESGTPCIGASIIVKNQPGLGTISDIDGKFNIKAEKYDIIVVTYVGFKRAEILVKKDMIIKLELSDASLNEVTVVGSGVQRKVSVVGAITTVDVQLLKVPSSSLSNSLAGNVSGIIARQTTGEPGKNNSEFWIRGISTFGANAAALVLVDGIERNFNEVNAEDIESFSVLKDASATAIYGQRGANGVVIINTKHGKEGKVNINAKSEFGISAPSVMPKYVDAVKYADLANEARLSRGQDPKYSAEEISIINNGLDPDLYPNVNWQNELLNKSTTSRRTMINISGGGSTARYFISGAAYNEDGLFKADNLNNYNTNANYNRYNFRSNIDVNITSSTVLELGIGGWISTQNKPGSSSDNIWGSLATLTAGTVPKMYSNGLFPTYGTGNATNPWVLLTQTGYKESWDNKLETNIAINQNLDLITKGLRFYTRFSYDAYNTNGVDRLKGVDLYRAETQRDGNGNLQMLKIANAYPLTQSTYGWGDRRYYFESNLNYNRSINKHRFGGLLLYYMQEFGVSNAGADIFAAIPTRNIALSGRATYSYNDTYLIETNIGYTGSENFQASSRYGLFPAIAAGWVVSNEKLIKDNLVWLNLLKIRYSFGLVGNDRLNQRFPYISTINANSGGYGFGDNGQSYQGGVSIASTGTPNLSWETSTKHNMGVDLRLLKKFSITADVFKDTRDKIFMRRDNIPGGVGLNGAAPWANVGKMENSGIDGTFSYNDKFGEVNVTLRGNFTYAKTKVINFDEASNAVPYQMTKGYSWGQTRGLIALGLFKDQADIDNSPVQTYGSVLPGDIKYKDVNGDGKITDLDIVPVGSQTVPCIIYGLGFSAQWKGLDFGMLLQGAGQSDFFLGGNGVFPFNGGEGGNILSAVANNSDRWISHEISGNVATENTNAMFPRLTYGNNPNNNRNSTFWLRDAQYLRLKNLEIGYNLPQKFLSKLMIKSTRIYLIGTNLLVFDKFKWWDPEIANGNGAVYPISKNVTMGLTISL